MQQADYFSGGSGTNFSSAATGTTQPSGFSHPTGTQASPSPAQAQQPAGPPGLTDWLNSSAARAYEGSWVLLSDQFDVIDSARSPSELLKRHPNIVSPVIVLVEPGGVQLAV